MAGEGKGANHGGWGIPGLVEAFLVRDGGDLLLAGRVAARGTARLT